VILKLVFKALLLVVSPWPEAALFALLEGVEREPANVVCVFAHLDLEVLLATKSLIALAIWCLLVKHPRPSTFAMFVAAMELLALVAMAFPLANNTIDVEFAVVMELLASILVWVLLVLLASKMMLVHGVPLINLATQPAMEVALPHLLLSALFF